MDKENIELYEAIQEYMNVVWVDRDDYIQVQNFNKFKKKLIDLGIIDD